MIPVVVGSSPIGHPIRPLREAPPRKWTRPVRARRATAGTAFVANACASLDQIAVNAPAVAAGAEPEYLHQLRVGIRRLRAALRAFRELVRSRPARRMDRRLRAILHRLGAARDWDVFCQSHANAGLIELARPESTAARRGAREVMKSARFGNALEEIRAWATSGPWRRGADPDEPLAGFAVRALQKLFRTLHEDAKRIDWRDSVRRHKIRIKVKRLRYAGDFFAPAFRRRAMRPFLETLKALQQVLGELNDIHMQRRLLRMLARDRSSIALIRAAGALLEARERALIAELRRSWTAFEALPRFWRDPATARARG